MTISDDFFAEAKKLNCRMIPDNPEEVRAVLDAKDAEIQRLSDGLHSCMSVLVSVEEQRERLSIEAKKQRETIAAAARVMLAWDTTVLPKSRDGMMQERMEELRACLEETTPAAG